MSYERPAKRVLADLQFQAADESTVGSEFRCGIRVFGIGSNPG